jgi:hypothetical protein
MNIERDVRKRLRAARVSYDVSDSFYFDELPFTIADKRWQVNRIIPCVQVNLQA